MIRDRREKLIDRREREDARAIGTRMVAFDWGLRDTVSGVRHVENFLFLFPFPWEGKIKKKKEERKIVDGIEIITVREV